MNITEVSFGSHDKAIAALEELKRTMPIAIQHQRFIASLIRARYDGLIDEGFTAAQATDIVKDMFK